MNFCSLRADSTADLYIISVALYLLSYETLYFKKKAKTKQMERNKPFI